MLAAQGAIVLLLFGFVWAVVRSSSKTLARAVPPALPLDDPVVRSADTAAHPVIPSAAPPPPADDWPETPIARADRPGPDFLRDDWDLPPSADEAPVEKPVADAAPVADPFAPPVDDTVAPELPPTDRAHAQSTAEVLAAGIEPRLVVEEGPARVGDEITLGSGLTIGRSPSNNLHCDDTYMSHMHARILRRGSFFFVQDLGSTNGTFLNGQRVDHAQLRHRDTLRLGETTLRYEE